MGKCSVQFTHGNPGGGLETQDNSLREVW